ncbi:hypothetical protein ACOMHN_039740 [Nucella lapillus]
MAGCDTDPQAVILSLNEDMACDSLSEAESIDDRKRYESESANVGDTVTVCADRVTEAEPECAGVTFAGCVASLGQEKDTDTEPEITIADPIAAPQKITNKVDDMNCKLEPVETYLIQLYHHLKSLSRLAYECLGLETVLLIVAYTPIRFAFTF